MHHDWRHVIKNEDPGKFATLVPGVIMQHTSWTPTLRMKLQIP